MQTLSLRSNPDHFETVVGEEDNHLLVDVCMPLLLAGAVACAPLALESLTLGIGWTDLNLHAHMWRSFANSAPRLRALTLGQSRAELSGDALVTLSEVLPEFPSLQKLHLYIDPVSAVTSGSMHTPHAHTLRRIDESVQSDLRCAFPGISFGVGWIITRACLITMLQL